jgi:cytochrome P450
MSAHPPVTDWATDFDHLDPRWNEDPFPIWAGLRQTCPVAHTERFQGAYFPSRYQDVRAIAYDTEHFSSRRIVVRDVQPEQPFPAPPITADPPDHKAWKQALLPSFTPDAVARLEPRCRALCDELIDGFIATGGCDVAQAYTRLIPVRMTAHMLGLPETDGTLFIRWIHEILELGITDSSVSTAAIQEVSAYFAAHIARRREQPTDDLITTLMDTSIDGAPVSGPHVLGMLRLLLVAGIDTTWSAIGAALWHLAKTPSDRERLIADPALLPIAVEELLRAYSPVTMAREVVKETVVGGCPFKAGRMVLLSFPAANRDPAMFPEPDRVVIDRAENRHAAFGLGIHRCVGSNLARMEMTVAVETFLRRIPAFSLTGPVRWSEGTVRGPRTLPMRFAA